MFQNLSVTLSEGKEGKIVNYLETINRVKDSTILLSKKKSLKFISNEYE